RCLPCEPLRALRWWSSGLVRATLEILEIERKRRKRLARPLKMWIVERTTVHFLSYSSRNSLEFHKLVPTETDEQFDRSSSTDGKTTCPNNPSTNLIGHITTRRTAFDGAHRFLPRRSPLWLRKRELSSPIRLRRKTVACGLSL